MNQETLRSATSIAVYFIIITIVSIIGLFCFIPRYDISIEPEDMKIISLNDQDNSIIFKGKVDSINSNRTADTVNLGFIIERKILKDTIVKDTIFTSTYTSSFPRKKLPNNTLLWLIIIVGILGASIHALTSLSEYVGNNSYDPNWAMWYYLRPFVGALLALLMYWFLRAGLISIDTNQGLYGTLAVAGLIGIFSKQALYKISDIANVLFMSNHEKKLSGKLSDNPVPILDEATISVKAGSTNTKVTLEGKLFVEGIKAYNKDAELPTTFVSATQIVVSLPDADIKNAGELVLTIKNPAPGGGEVTKAITIIGPTNPNPDTSIAENQVPIVDAEPLNVKAGSTNNKVTINGKQFVKETTAYYKDKPLETAFVSATQIEVSLPDAYVKVTGELELKIENPSPGGGAVTKTITIDP